MLTRVRSKALRHTIRSAFASAGRDAPDRIYLRSALSSFAIRSAKRSGTGCCVIVSYIVRNCAAMRLRV